MDKDDKRFLKDVFATCVGFLIFLITSILLWSMLLSK